MITLSTDDAGGRAVYLFIDGQLQGQVPLTGEYKWRLRSCKFVCYFRLPKLRLQYSKDIYQMVQACLCSSLKKVSTYRESLTSA